MLLGNLKSAKDVLLIWIACSSCGMEIVDLFTLVYPIFLVSLGVKYRLKGPVNPIQTTDQVRQLLDARIHLKSCITFLDPFRYNVLSFPTHSPVPMNMYFDFFHRR